MVVRLKVVKDDCTIIVSYRSNPKKSLRFKDSSGQQWARDTNSTCDHECMRCVLDMHGRISEQVIV